MTQLDRLYQTHLFAEKNGLENMERLCAHYVHPEKCFRSIHIAGSNGKGSVAVKIAAGLRAAGNRVGLFTSPHIRQFHERIQINGVMIEDETLNRQLKNILDFIDEQDIPATFFEVTTLCAFLFFAEAKVDYAVIETGLGGRYDATNVVLPEVSVITSISLEHTEILGSTIEAIAREKAGIIKPGVPVVIGPTVPLDVISSFTRLIIPISVISDTFVAENNAIASAAMKELGLDQLCIDAGLRATPPCRMEVSRGDVTIIRDGAHNPHAIERLLETLKAQFGWNRFHLVCSFGWRKDMLQAFKLLQPVCETITLLEPVQERLATVDAMQQALPLSMPFLGTSTEEALSRAKITGFPVLITGSFYIFKDITITPTEAPG